MRRLATAVPIALAAAALSAASPAPGGPAGTLEMYSGPGIGYHAVHGGGCHTFGGRTLSYASSAPVADYVFHSGPDCTGRAVGEGRAETQWFPPLRGIRSVDLRFEH